MVCRIGRTFWGVCRASHMSIVKDLATEATPNFTWSIREGWGAASSEEVEGTAGTVVVEVVGAGWPENLQDVMSTPGSFWGVK